MAWYITAKIQANSYNINFALVEGKQIEKRNFSSKIVNIKQYIDQHVKYLCQLLLESKTNEQNDVSCKNRSTVAPL